MSNFDKLTTRGLLQAYNERATALGKKTVNRFSDRAAGLRRLLEIDAAYRAAGKTAPARTPRPPRFKFPPQRPTVAPRGNDNLRTRCEALLERREGATVAEVEEMVAEFDRERGKQPFNIHRRTYELIRIMHYQLGHGLEERDGRIHLVAVQPKLLPQD